MHDRVFLWKSAGIALIPFVLYICTAPRSIYLGDNPEFITAGLVGGVAHPPGYPLLTLLAWLFSFMPFGPDAMRLNMISVLSGSLAVFFFILCLHELLLKTELKYKNLIAWGMGIVVGATASFWKQATILEAYALNSLFVTVLLYLALCFRRTKDTRLIYWSAAIAGLSLTNHHMMLFFLPGIAWMFFDQYTLSKKILGGAFLLGVLPLLLYAYLPLRSTAGAALDWGMTGASIDAFLAHIFRLQYADIGGLFIWSDKLLYFKAFLANTYSQFGFLLLFLLPGIPALARKSKELTLVLLGTILLHVGSIILVRGLRFNEDTAFQYTEYYTTVYIILALFIGIGIAETLRWLTQKYPSLSQQGAQGGIIITFSLIVLFLIGSQYGAQNARTFTFLHEYSKRLLESLPHNSVLLISSSGLSGDPLYFSLLYQRVAKRLRPDIEILGGIHIFHGTYRPDILPLLNGALTITQRDRLVAFAIEHPHLRERPIFATFIPPHIPSGYTIASNGLLFELLPYHKVSQAQPVPHFLTEKDEKLLEADRSGQDVLALYYLAQSAKALEARDKKASLVFITKTFYYENNKKSLDISSFQTTYLKESLPPSTP